jgi:glyoxalase-like protein
LTTLLGCLRPTLRPVEIDHVLVAVVDLATAAREMEEHHGLASIEGGRHPGWGTANRIVPLGETYLELAAVVDEVEARQSVFGRWVASGANISGRPIGWAVRAHDIEQVGRRLGLTVRAGSRVTPNGDRLEWRAAGMEEAAAEGFLPFFIEWGAGTAFPGHALVKHPGGTPVITRILIHGDADRLAYWLGGHELPIVVTPGTPMLAGIILSRPDRFGQAGPVVLLTS